jgi:excisionase family DNA binding protein
MVYGARMDERYLSAAETAERLGISLRTVRRRIADGSLPSIKVGGAVRIPASALEVRPAPRNGSPAVREAAADYATERESREAYIRRWNWEHWPDTWDAMLRRRREGFAQLAEIRRRTKPPSGPHDTVDAMLNEVREEFGARLLQFLPAAPGDTE